MLQTSIVLGTSVQHTATNHNGQPIRAIVVFEDRQERSLIRLLRPGFRHCFCLVGGDLAWTVCDPLLTRIELVPLLGFAEAELAGHYARSGRSVLLGNILRGRTRRVGALRPMSCVEVLKRVLNVDTRHVFTPFQLYRTLLELPTPGERYRRHSIDLDVAHY